MAKAEKIKIAIADDHPLIVEGLVEKINRRSEMEVVGTYADPDALLNEYPRIKPAVVVLDLYFGENRTRGVEAIKKIKAKYPDARIVVFSQADQLTVIREAYSLGVLAYVTKDARVDVLWDAIAHAAAREHFYTPEVARRFAVQATIETPLDTLTDRETEVFELAAAGLSNPEISAKMGIAPRTVANMRVEIKKKLNVKTNSDLTLLAVRLKLIEPRSSQSTPSKTRGN